MTIHFAAARPALAVHFVHARRIGGLLRAANDNHSGRRDLLPREALRHFAAHGLRAATVARGNAEEAHRAGDGQGYAHWLEICRTLDRRMALALQARIERNAL